MVDHDVIVIGGGIVGMATAVSLMHRGIENITVYEKAQALHPVGAAIGLFPNGLAALKEISKTVYEKVNKSCVENRQNLIKDLSGKVVMDMDATKTSRVMPSYMVWYLLQQYLAEDLQPGMLHLGYVFECYRVEPNGTVTVSLRSRKENIAIQRTCRVLIGADGIQSAVRRQLVGGIERSLRYHGKVMYRGVLNMNEVDQDVCPPTGVSLAYQGHVQGQLFAFRETAPGILTFTSMARMEEQRQDETTDEHQKARLQQLFEGYPKDVRHLIERVDNGAILENSVYDLPRVEQVWSKGPVLVVGDAAHAMTPGMGQGANIGLEDACELSHKVSRAVFLGEQRISEALQDFWKGRLERVERIHEASCTQTQKVNKSTTDNPLRFEQGADFYEILYRWTPSSSMLQNELV